MSIAEQNQKCSIKSCEGCMFLSVLFGFWLWDDCIARGRNFYGILMIERVFNARAEWGHCGPERKNYRE